MCESHITQPITLHPAYMHSTTQHEARSRTRAATPVPQPEASSASSHAPMASRGESAAERGDLHAEDTRRVAGLATKVQ